MEAVDCVVVGAGVVGLAIARAVAQSGREVLILERNERHGLETSSRNSEVIHAGLYYPPGSLKARHCVRGRALLYEYCAARSLPHRRCGKLVVAAGESSQQALQGLGQAGAANGVDDLALLDATQARQLEPALRCDAALLSPSTGIVDVHAYMLALLADAESAGARLVLRTSVERLLPSGAGIEVLCQGDPQPVVRARWVINAAGLWATELAARIDGLPAASCPGVRYAKGNYFSLAGRAPFSHLIYPLPAPDALGVHLTLDLAGQARFGPDLEWVRTVDYAVDSRRLESFVPRIRSFWPEVPVDRLVPAYAGIRPKISVAGSAFADFRIDGPAEHGVEGIINLFGIESPGLTASLAIAEQVAGLVGAG